MLIDVNSHMLEWAKRWTAVARGPRLVAACLLVLIVVGLETPAHDTIRFSGKYMILCLGITVALKHAMSPGNAFAKHWFLVACALILWIIGFSANYISECLWHSIGKTYHTVHDLAYLYKHILILCVAILPPADEEKPSDIGFLVIGLTLLAVLHRYALAESSDPFVSGSSFIHLAMCLTFDDLILVVILLALFTRKYTVRHAHGRCLYSSLLCCIVAYTIASTSYLYGGYSPWFLPTWIQTFMITDAPELIFLMIASLPLTTQQNDGKATRNLISETLSLTVSTALPAVTCTLAILVALTPGRLAVGASVGLVSIAVCTTQFCIKYYHTQKQLEACHLINKQLEHLSLNDAVTGTYNRRWFDETLTLGCNGATEGNPSIVVLMLDVDYFKGYNDTLGHRGGDFCLRAVSEAVQSCLHRERDAVARYGGDELAAILFQTSAAGGAGIAERMRRAVWDLNISHPTNPHGRVTVSIGVGVPGATPNLIRPLDLVGAADAALYESKAHGRNRVTLRETTAGEENAEKPKECDTPVDFSAHEITILQRDKQTWSV
jgi:diguanylate cyclase (GGDEF)-like protein